MHTALTTAFQTARRASAVLVAGVFTYAAIRTLQRVYTVPPHLPCPEIPPNEEDGRVMGILKRRLYQHFYVVRKDESLVRLHAWCERYSHKPFLMNIFVRPHIVLSNAADVESVLLRQESKFCKGAGYDIVRKIIGDGLLAVGCKSKHAVHRRILAPIFSNANIRGMSNEVTRMQSLRMLGSLFEVLERSGDSSITVNLSDHINKMALAAIGEAAFRASREESIQVRSAFDTLTRLCRTNYFCPFFRTRTQQEANQMVASICDVLLEKSMTVRHAGMRRTVMDVLIDELYEKFSPQDVVDHLVTFLFAGHDTTSHTLQFLFAVLGSHPRVQEKLYESLQDIMPTTCTCPPVEELLQCDYLEATAKEVLRLYPAAPILYRDATEAVSLPSGVVVPSGWTAVISIFSLHRNKSVFGADADVFRPERWLGAEGEQLRKRCGRCGYIPFSCGRRNCIGQEFGHCEMLITTALLVRHLRLELVGDFPVTKYKITMATKDPVFVRLRARSDISVQAVHRKISQSFTAADDEKPMATPMSATKSVSSHVNCSPVHECG